MPFILAAFCLPSLPNAQAAAMLFSDYPFHENVFYDFLHFLKNLEKQRVSLSRPGIFSNCFARHELQKSKEFRKIFGILPREF